MNSKFGARDSFIHELFFDKTDTRFRIPRNQRPYKWTEKHIREFWDTLSEDLRTGKPSFIGTIIIFREGQHTEIVDGQQRYTTIQILAACLRNICLTIPDPSGQLEKYAKTIQKIVIGREQDWGGQGDKFYLTAADSLRPYLEKHVLAFKPKGDIHDKKLAQTAEERTVRMAYLMFESLLLEQFEKLTPAEVARDSKRLIEALGQQTIVLIEVHDSGFAYVIFETVNAKGLFLSAADLVKNQIFFKLDTDPTIPQGSAKSKWDSMRSALRKSSFRKFTEEDLISYYWSSKNDYVSSRKLYGSIKDALGDNPKNWLALLEDLDSTAEVIQTLGVGRDRELAALVSKRDARQFVRSVHHLRKTKSRTWTILCLSLLRNSNKLGIEVGDLWEALADYSLLYFDVMGKPGNWFHKVMTKHAKYLEIASSDNGSREKALETIVSLASELKGELPTNDQFQKKLASIRYRTGRQEFLTFLLSRIESELQGSESEGFDEKKLTLDHISPQKPKKIKVGKDYRDQVHRLGNLVLVSGPRNSRMQNKAISEKVTYYKKSNLRQTRELVSKIKSGAWKFEDVVRGEYDAIDKRQQTLVNLAYKSLVEKVRSQLIKIEG